MSEWFKELFIDEAKSVLSNHDDVDDVDLTVSDDGKGNVTIRLDDDAQGWIRP